MTDPVAVGEQLLSAIGDRSYEAIAGCFAADATFDVLTPHRLRRHSTSDEAAERYRHWLGGLEDFAVLESDVVEIADRIRIRYRFRGRDPDAGWQLNEHTGYAAVGDGRISSMTLTCAGFRPIPPPDC